jgi:hypothetical protein
MLAWRPAPMKQRRAWLACSVVSATYLLASCGSDDGKRRVTPADAGAAGAFDGGEPGAGGSSLRPEAGAGGQSVEPTAGMSSAGEAGAPLGGAGGAALAGNGGEGGQAAPAFCFGLIDDPDGVGGAGGQGGQNQVFALQFRCEDLSTSAPGSHFDPETNKLTLPFLEGMEPALRGRVVAQYADTCEELPVVPSASGLGIQLDPQAVVTYIDIRWLELEDECGQTVSMDVSGQPDFCFGVQVYGDVETGWSIDCYEGYLEDCGQVCDPPL